VTDEPTRVLLIEDQTVFREALAVVLEREPDVEITGLVGTIAEARSCLAHTPADVAVTELDLPDGPCTDLICDLRHVRPLVQVLILTATANGYELGEAVNAGAAGVLDKRAPLAEIVTAVRRLCAGQPVVEPAELVRLVCLEEARRSEQESARMALARLTRREHEVLVALAQGMSDKEIAQQLHVGRETVHTHMVNLLGKLGVDSRLQALLFAVKHGWCVLARRDSDSHRLSGAPSVPYHGTDSKLLPPLVHFPFISVKEPPMTRLLVLVANDPRSRVKLLRSPCTRCDPTSTRSQWTRRPLPPTLIATIRIWRSAASVTSPSRHQSRPGYSSPPTAAMRRSPASWAHDTRPSI
jgi:DNA-binding NarL/FixJ family response regulator